MAYITLDESLPGMRSLLAYRPAIAEPLTRLMQVLMRNDEGISKGERELIATYVSLLNNCEACFQIHGAITQCLLSEESDLIEKLRIGYQNLQISDKIKHLLAIAGSVQQGGRFVTEQQITQAKSSGASDLEIHDTVLIAALFCFFNRYIDGLGLVSNDTSNSFKERAKMIAEIGYK
jgi:uncharacterized peroxidase-related enzyme